MKLWLIPTFAIWYIWKLFYLLLCHYHWVSNPCLIRNWKIVIFLLFLFLFFLFTLSDLVLQADLVLKIAILCVYVFMIANEWFFLLCVVTVMCFLIGFLSPLGCILSAHLDSVTLKSIHSCTKRHVLWRHGSFQIESSLTRSPKDIKNLIRSLKLAAYEPNSFSKCISIAMIVLGRSVLFLSLQYILTE